VYFPPTVQYAIEVEPDRKDGKYTMWMLDEHRNKVEPYRGPRFETAMVHTKRGETIATMYIGCPGSRTMLLFSHGNATDIGCMRDHLIDLSQQLQVNIFTYDYSGYGLSTGKANAHNTLSDIEAAYDYMIKKYPTECNVVILYGQSLGTGPTIYLSRVKRVTGIVIHSGLMSALRVIKPVPDTRWFDIYPNIDLIKEVKCPVFIIHGTADQEIPVHHGQALASIAPNPYKPYWVEGAGHNNIEVHWREPYLERMRQFVGEMERLEVKRATQPQPHSPSSLSLSREDHLHPLPLRSVPPASNSSSSGSSHRKDSSGASVDSRASLSSISVAAVGGDGPPPQSPSASPVHRRESDFGGTTSFSSSSSSSSSSAIPSITVTSSSSSSDAPKRSLNGHAPIGLRDMVA